MYTSNTTKNKELILNNINGNNENSNNNNNNLNISINNNNCIINNNNSNNNFEKNNNDEFIYIFSGNDHNDINSLYKFNIKSKKIEKMKFKNKNQFGTFRGSLFSISTTTDSIYISNGNSILKYCLWTQETNLLVNNWDNSLYRSTFYDKNNDFIYFIGGVLNGEIHDNIYRWSLKTDEYKFYCKTSGPILEAQLCYCPKEHSIYMLGGWVSEVDYNQTIDCFNIKDRKVTTIYHFDKKQTYFSHSCYVAKNHSLYIYKWKVNEFYRFDIKTKTIYPLASCINKTNFSRLLFDGDDSIFIPNDSTIYEFKCSTNQWCSHNINIDNKYLYTSHRF